MNYNFIVHGLFIFAMYVAWVRCSVWQKLVHIVSTICVVSFYVMTNIFSISDKIIFYFRCSFIAIAFALIFLAILSNVVQLPGIKISKKEKLFTIWIINPIQAMLGFFFYTLIKILPLKVASKFGESAGRLSAKTGIPVNKKALENIHKCFPEKTDAECKKILSDSWAVFLRFVFEVPHLDRLHNHTEKYIEIDGLEKLNDLKGKPFVVVFAHYGNISLMPLPFDKANINSNVIFRYPNNRLMSWFFFRMLAGARSAPVPKGDAGTRLAMKALTRKEALLVAVDQRFEGTGSLDLKFFGRKAPTAPGSVKFAKIFDAPILPLQVIQLPNSKYKIIVHDSFMPGANTAVNAQKINDIIEGWVRQYPEQWFWLHKRWGRK